MDLTINNGKIIIIHTKSLSTGRKGIYTFTEEKDGTISFVHEEMSGTNVQIKQPIEIGKYLEIKYMRKGRLWDYISIYPIQKIEIGI